MSWNGEGTLTRRGSPARPAGADRPSGQVFAAAEEKYKTAAAAFEGVERRFGSSKTGLRAKYYAGLSRLELGQHAEAEKALKEIQPRGAGLEPDLARLALAETYRRSGEVDKAVETYRALASNPSASMPRDHALMSAAQMLEEARRFTEARTTYRPVDLYQIVVRVTWPSGSGHRSYEVESLRVFKSEDDTGETT